MVVWPRFSLLLEPILRRRFGFSDLSNWGMNWPSLRVPWTGVLSYDADFCLWFQLDVRTSD